MTAQTKEEFQPKEDPPTTNANTPEKKEKQENVCCFCPIRPCPLLLLVLLTPIIALGMYSAFYDPHYVYVIVAYGIPSTSGNKTDVQNKTELPKAVASTQTEGGVVTVKKITTIESGGRSKQDTVSEYNDAKGSAKLQEKEEEEDGEEKKNEETSNGDPWDIIIGMIETFTGIDKKP